MSKINIDELQIGQELDSLVATWVMGWIPYSTIADSEPCAELWLEEREGFEDPQWTGYTAEDLPGLTAEIRWHTDDGIASMMVRAREWKPSTNIAAAWRVVERLTDKDKPFPRFCIYWCNQLNWAAEFQMTKETFPPRASAETPELAICRAALKAVMDES